jgi:TonB family protein
MFRCIILAGLAAMFADGASVAGPTEFYVVSEFFSDNGALFYYRILDVKPDGSDTIVRYIRVAPVAVVCARRIIVQAAEARLPNVSLAAIVGNRNPCAVNSKTLSRAIQSNSRKASVLEAISFGIVAKCGSETNALGLPIADGVNFERMKKSHPEMERLWDLTSTVIGRAFGSMDVFNDISEAADLQLQREGEQLVPILRFGQYDLGLAEATRGGVSKWSSPSFRQVLDGYQKPVSKSEIAAAIVPHLVDSGSYKFGKYVDPVYPPLAKSARIEGRVELQLLIDSSTGEVKDASALSGHPILRQSAIAAVKQWRFSAGSIDSETAKVVLDFALRCP